MYSGWSCHDGWRPAAGFAGREARWRIRDVAAEKEGAHAGTMGSPMRVRFLDV